MFKFDKFSLSKHITAPSVERVVEFSPSGIDIADIAKVLSLAVDGKCLTVNAGDGFAEVDGRANFRLIYLDKEGNGRGVDYNADFSVKVEGAFGVDDNLSAAVEIIEADASATDSLTLSAVIEVGVSATEREEIEALTDAEKCYKTMKSISLPAMTAAKTINVPVEDEINVGDVNSVLLLDSGCAVKKITVEDNLVKIEGNAFATVTYSENGEINSRTFEIPVTEEVSVDGVAAGDYACAECSVRSARIVLQGVTGDNVIRLEGELCFKLQVFRAAQTALVADMFMLTNEIETTKKTCSFSHFSGYKYFSERVTGNAILGDNRAAAREIVALPYARCYTAKAETGEDGLTVEGIVNTDIIYSDENGYNSVRTEVPFSVLIPGEFANDVKVRTVVESISARVKRDREIEVNMTLGFMVCEFDTCTAEYIAAVEVGEEKEQNTSALSLYIASEGDEMWDVCKALTATPEEILSQNPALSTPLSGGEKVIFFRALTQ